MMIKGKPVRWSSLSVDGIMTARGLREPYWNYAEYDDGSPLTEDDLDALNEIYADDMYDWMLEHR